MEKSTFFSSETKFLAERGDTTEDAARLVMQNWDSPEKHRTAVYLGRNMVQKRNRRKIWKWNMCCKIWRKIVSVEFAEDEWTYTLSSVIWWYFENKGSAWYGVLSDVSNGCAWRSFIHCLSSILDASGLFSEGPPERMSLVASERRHLWICHLWSGKKSGFCARNVVMKCTM